MSHRPPLKLKLSGFLDSLNSTDSVMFHTLHERFGYVRTTCVPHAYVLAFLYLASNSHPTLSTP